MKFTRIFRPAPKKETKTAQTIPAGTVEIRILGTGCRKCIALKNAVDEVVKSLDGTFDVQKVEDVQEIMRYGVISTPGFVINGEVKSTGKALSTEEIKKFIQEVQDHD